MCGVGYRWDSRAVVARRARPRRCRARSRRQDPASARESGPTRPPFARESFKSTRLSCFSSPATTGQFSIAPFAMRRSVGRDERIQSTSRGAPPLDIPATSVFRAKRRPAPKGFSTVEMHTTRRFIWQVGWLPTAMRFGAPAPMRERIPLARPQCVFDRPGRPPRADREGWLACAFSLRNRKPVRRRARTRFLGCPIGNTPRAGCDSRTIRASTASRLSGRAPAFAVR